MGVELGVGVWEVGVGSESLGAGLWELEEGQEEQEGRTICSLFFTVHGKAMSDPYPYNHLIDDRVMPGRSLPNSEIWERSLEALQRSRERQQGPEYSRTWPAQAALNLVKAAKLEAKRRRRAGEMIEGEEDDPPRPYTYKDILKEHAREVDHLSRERSSRFLSSTQGGTGREESTSAQWPGLARAARVAQDERRQTAQTSELMQRAAQRVEVETAPVEPYLGDVYERFPRLRPEAGPSFDGLLARPPPSSASDTPNADRLALEQAMLEYTPPPLPHNGPPPPLMNNPQGGGGQHNPVELDDSEEEN